MNFLEKFKDIIPAFLQPETAQNQIGELNIPEFVKAQDVNANAGLIGSNLSMGMDYTNIHQLVRQYKLFSQIDFVDEAIDEIVNESIVIESNNTVVKLNLDKLDMSKSIKNKINDEFDNIKSLLNFDMRADEYFREWYVTGRKYQQYLFHKNTKKGILKIVDLSPFKVIRIYDEKTNKFWYYIETSDDNKIQNGYIDKREMIKNKNFLVSSDHVNFIHSGLKDAYDKYFVSYLHRAIKPANQLNLLEDSMVVYRFTRAPERRAFYIDVGRLGKSAADTYIQKLMSKFKTRLHYDTSTGMVNQKKSVMTMLEDYWLPRMGSKGTEIQSLSGGQQLGEITDIKYMKGRVWKALRIPASRADNDNPSMISFGDDTLNREELKFNKRCQLLRKKFSRILTEPLRVQLIAKKIINPEEWDYIISNLYLEWNEDSYWTETKDAAIFNNRLDTLDRLENHLGKYFSHSWAKKNILKQDDAEIAQMKKEIEDEIKSGDINNDEDE